MASVPGPSTIPSPSIGKEEENFSRLCQLIMTICSDLFRDILCHYIDPADLRSALDKNKKKIEKLKSINSAQLQILYPAPGNTPTVVEDMDICLLYTLLRNICNIKPHKGKWGYHPKDTDNSLVACMERIRGMRNSIYGHIKKGSVDDVEFQKYWSELKNDIVEIEKHLQLGKGYEIKVDKLLTCELSPSCAKRYVEELKRLETRIDDVERSTKRKIASKKAMIDGVKRSTKRKIASKKARVDILEKKQNSAATDLKEQLHDMEQHILHVLQGKFSAMEQHMNDNSEKISAMEQNLKARLDYMKEEQQQSTELKIEAHLDYMEEQQQSTELKIEARLDYMEEQQQSTAHDIEEKLSQMNKKVQNTLCSLILLPSALLTRTFEIEEYVDGIYRMFHVKSGRLWIESSSELIHVDTDGNVIETINSQGPCCVTSDGALLYADTSDGDKNTHCIKKKTPRRTTTLLVTEIGNKPICIHSSHINSDILMLKERDEEMGHSFQRLYSYMITRYDEKGEKIRDMMIDVWWLRYSPMYMTENRNGDIISGGQMKAVVVMDSSGRHRFNYSDPENKYPRAVCTDKLGHILVAFDFCIHLLDEDGKLQKILIENNVRFINDFQCLCLDDKQNLYAGTENGIIKVYKYLKDY